MCDLHTARRKYMFTWRRHTKERWNSESQPSHWCPNGTMSLHLYHMSIVLLKAYQSRYLSFCWKKQEALRTSREGNSPAVGQNKYETSISSLCARHVFVSLHTHREPNVTYFKPIPVSAYFKVHKTASSSSAWGKVCLHRGQLSYSPQ
jgi:hypothetical protein